MTATALAAAAALVLSLLTTSAATAQTGPKVLISELSNYGPAGSADEIIELTNYGDQTAHLDGWGLYRCTAAGSRAYDPQIPPLDGVTLDPGETYLVANAAGTVDDADAYYDISLANAGFGVWLQDRHRNIIDTVAAYAAPVDSECALDGTPLPNDLNGIRDQTWQRLADTGDDHADFIRARRTPGAANATEPDPGPVPSDVLVSELTNGGPGGSSDNFVEFANYGTEPVDIGLWRFYRCWGSGRTTPGSLQTTIPEGTVLEPGDVFVAAHASVDVPDGVAHGRYSTSLANVGFGAMLVDDDGDIRDSVGVYETDGYHQPPTGSPCTRGTALPNRLDYGWNQTWQRVAATGDNAADFTSAERTIGHLAAPDPAPGPERVDTGVRISELVNAGPGGGADEFFELANFGDEPVSLEGWTVHRCQEDGRRNAQPQIPVIGDVVLQPGQTYLAVHTASSYFDLLEYDAAYDVGMATDGFGLILLTDEGDMADGVGVYNALYSPCTQGLSLMNIIDRADGDTFQRFDSTGYNADDLVTAEASPGTVPDDLRSPTAYTDDELADVDVPAAPRPLEPDTDVQTGDREATLTATADHTTGGEIELAFTGAEQIDLNLRASRIWTGTTDQAPPTTRRIQGEQDADTDVLDGSAPLVTEATDGHPFQRFELRLDRNRHGTFEVTWSGTSTGTNEIQLYAWNHRDDLWELIAAGGGITGGQITLTGEVDTRDHARGRKVDLLVQDGPGLGDAFSDQTAEPNQEFKDPDEYDLSFGFVTDTQHLTEGYRGSYAELSRWLVANDAARDIEYTVHTGDVIQNWLNGTHSSERAGDEYEFASDAMGILEAGDHPYGILPGNHDNKWGRESSLFNQYFPVDRFEDLPWYGGAWRTDDSQNHYDLVEIDGAKFLFLYLGFHAGDEAIAWANEVLAAHPDHNAIFAIHEYLNPDGSLSTPDNYRWTSMADRY